tara:strand:+ start:191 stop:463 length:273 start_codon:yes stop_codon:yes gene_type:complete
MILKYLIYTIVFLILLSVIIITIVSINKVKKFQSDKSTIGEKNDDKKTSNLEVGDVSEKLVKEIKELNRLRDEGVLTDEEFIKAKEKILN